MQSKQTILTFLLFISTVIGAIAQSPKSYSSSELLLQLKKLNTVGSVLYIAAHPDDENTRLIAYLANEKCLRTGYLSLTRGDGGQNLIGSEQGIELGIIRTQELLAARRVDGGEQFFTRAYDFGYSKTPLETFNKWNHDSILGDMVWAIRNFRPDIIITRFATDGSGGHGHHTASAILAEEAFDAAADPTKFPEQLAYVSVWKTRRLFWNVSTRFQNPNADMSPYIKMDVGGYNPLIGKSYGEIAAESRSMHKSQGFGSARQRGESLEFFKPIKGDTTGLKTIFDGIDFTWKRVVGSEMLSDSLPEIIKSFDPTIPSLTVKRLLMYKNLFTGNTAIGFDEIIASLSGLVVEANAEQPYYSKGDSIRFTLSTINRSNQDMKVSNELIGNYLSDFNIPVQNYIDAKTKVKFKPEFQLKNNVLTTTKLFGFVQIPFENNFFYSNGIKNNFYVAPNYLKRQMPEQLLTPFIINFIDVDYQKISYQKQLMYKSVDPEKGELLRPMIITPPVLINLENNVLIFNDNLPKEVTVNLKAMRDSVSGLIRIATPQGWFVEGKENSMKKYLKVSEEYGRAFSINKKGETEVVHLVIYPPKTESYSSITINAEIKNDSYSLGMKEIKYDHIPVQTLFTKAEAKLIRLDVKHKLKKIGYIPGAGDEVQPCLMQIGYEVTTITDDYLAKGDLSKFEAIVTGIRAYNTNDKLSDYKQRLMEYVKNGGNLIVQYNTNSFAGPLKADLGPYKFKITRDRITDEEAKVTFDIPDHAVFNKPNKITSTDFEGWIQERSIYHAGDWDANFVAPISMNDPGEKPNKGALIIAKYGKGNYIYTGLVFFRELPAGVPGAYRLFVNLIELGK